MNFFDRTIRTRVYSCTNRKCNWSGKKPNLLYQSGPRRKVCPLCMSEVERLHTDTEGDE